MLGLETKISGPIKEFYETNSTPHSIFKYLLVCYIFWPQIIQPGGGGGGVVEQLSEKANWSRVINAKKYNVRSNNQPRN